MNDATTSVVVGTVLLCLVAATASGSSVSVSVPGPADRAPPDPLHPQVETDRVELVAAVDADGDAEWRVNYVTEIENDQNESEAFDELAADIRQNPDNYTDRFADRIRNTVRTAENATGREMRATNFEVTTRKDFVNGIVSYTFEWSNFGNRSAGGDRIAVGDAIEGFVLNPDTSLQIQWSDGWAATAVAPEPDSSPGRAVVWRGANTDFGPDQPTVVLERRAGTPTASPTSTGTPGGDDTPTDATGPGGTSTGDPSTGTGTETRTEPGTAGSGPGPDQGGGLPMGVLALVAVVAVVGIAWWRRPSGGSGTGTDPATATGGTDADASGTGSPADGSTAEAAAGSEPADGEGDDSAPAAVDEELLSNEERVLRLLERRGGRMKQQEVVEALGWTEAKTSQVVSGMREDDAIDSFRLGRENVLTLPDEDIDPTEDQGEN